MAQEDSKSRSQIKREHHELKDLGIQLVGLSSGQLQAMPLSPATCEAVQAARGMTRRALQRQLRHLASLMEEEDAAAVREALSGALQPHATEVAAMHRAESWREELISGDEKLLARFAEEHPACDRRRLRQLVRNTRRERDLDKPPRSARQLFRYLKSLASD